MTDCFISLILPAYNEEKRITPALHSIYDYLSNQNYSYEIILVDDGSTDNTVQLMRNFNSDDKPITVLINDENRGKGYTVKKGMLFAKGEYIFFTDTDLSTPIDEIEKCLPYLNDNYDVVIGSRSLPDSNIIIHQPWYREKMGKIFNFMVKTLLIKGIIDTQCGFKGYKNHVAKTVYNRCVIDGFSFDVETIFLAQKYNYKIKEVPVKWKDSSLLSKVNPVKHSIQMFIDLVCIKINDLKGRYD